MSVMRAATSGSFRMRAFSALRKPTISFGVPAGTKEPNQLLMSKPGRPDSASAGTSGRTRARRADEMASARSLPDCRCGIALPITTKPNCGSCPASKAATCGAPPLYGTCTMSVPVAFLNISPARCAAEPSPTVR